MNVMSLILSKHKLKVITSKEIINTILGNFGKEQNHLILCIIASIWILNIVSYRQWCWFSEHEGSNSSEALDCATCQSQGKFQLAYPWLIIFIKVIAKNYGLSLHKKKKNLFSNDVKCYLYIVGWQWNHGMMLWWRFHCTAMYTSRIN